ncbi:MAG: NAD(P)H-dependent glycerol-3-phosphate dehydrogenase [Bacteroidetes bacterium]|nr:NAD(P)H-dependent glycerol-3-phosphate dehydrogenase [Bacteroidota bacterium]
MKTRSIGILGGGSWATALAKILLNNVEQLNWWMRDASSIEHIQTYHHNPKYLRDVEFNVSKLVLNDNIREVIAKCDILVVAIPSAFLHESFDGCTKEDFKDKIIISAIKGIVPQYNLIPADYFSQVWDADINNIGIIAGPCHAEEVALERLSYLTVAFHEEAKAIEFTQLLKARYINTSYNDDLLGTEYCAVMKNVYAIASGICHGLGYGDNFQAVLISNSIREAEFFLDKVSPVHRDVKSSAYLGDLLVTCYSQFSRNRTFGNMIGKGYSVKHTMLEMNMVAEGYYATKCIHEIKQTLNVEMPIFQSVYDIIYQGKNAKRTMVALQDKLI